MQLRACLHGMGCYLLESKKEKRAKMNAVEEEASLLVATWPHVEFASSQGLPPRIIRLFKVCDSIIHRH